LRTSASAVQTGRAAVAIEKSSVGTRKRGDGNIDQLEQFVPRHDCATRLRISIAAATALARSVGRVRLEAAMRRNDHGLAWGFLCPREGPTIFSGL
jgi:hypothetical protein